MRRLPTILALALSLLGPIVLASPAGRILGDLALLRTKLIGQFALWCLAAIVVAIVLLWERRPLSSIGLFAPAWDTIVLGVALAGAFIYLIAPFAIRVVSYTGLAMFESGFTRNLKGSPRWFLVFAAITGGTVEETLYRGYAVERLAELTNSLVLGGLLSVVVFAVAHVPFWGPGPALTTFITGGVATAFYIWRRDLLANVIAHVLTDTVGLLALSSILR